MPSTTTKYILGIIGLLVLGGVVAVLIIVLKPKKIEVEEEVGNAYCAENP